MNKESRRALAASAQILYERGSRDEALTIMRERACLSEIHQHRDTPLTLLERNELCVEMGIIEQAMERRCVQS